MYNLPVLDRAMRVWLDSEPDKPMAWTPASRDIDAAAFSFDDALVVSQT
jgi:hypothetical protein